MIITCANCQSRFKVPDEKVGSRARRVRCGKCGNIFVISPEGVVAEPRPSSPPNPSAPATLDPFAGLDTLDPSVSPSPSPDPFASFNPESLPGSSGALDVPAPGPKSSGLSGAFAPVAIPPIAPVSPTPLPLKSPPGHDPFAPFGPEIAESAVPPPVRPASLDALPWVQPSDAAPPPAITAPHPHPSPPRASAPPYIPLPARRIDPNQAIGRYELLRPLATGGMGEIFLARLQGIGGFEKPVVLKRLRPEMAARPQAAAMFLDEVRLLSHLHHANVVEIYDVDTTPDGAIFYAMEYLHGQDLRTIMRHATRKSGLTVAQAVAIASATLNGLHHVHEITGQNGQSLNVVHRDVSPANVMVTYAGGVKLLDFGIAKAKTSTTETADGVVKGKFRYMSPEQCRSEPVDRRSDIFSMGIVLWEISLGKGLFRRDDDVQTLFAIVEKDAPSPRSLNPDYPPELERIVMKALSRDKDKRYATAREMQLDLEEFARLERLPQGSTVLTDLMAELFADDLAAWRQAQREGKDLTAYVMERPSESESGLVNATPISGQRARISLIEAAPVAAPMAPTIPEMPAIAPPAVSAPPAPGSGESPGSSLFSPGDLPAPSPAAPLSTSLGDLMVPKPSAPIAPALSPPGAVRNAAKPQPGFSPRTVLIVVVAILLINAIGWAVMIGFGKKSSEPAPGPGTPVTAPPSRP